MWYPPCPQCKTVARKAATHAYRAFASLSLAHMCRPRFVVPPLATVSSSIGITLISILVTITKETTELCGSEARVLDITLRDDRRYRKRHVAATLLQRAAAAHRAFRRHGRGSAATLRRDRAYAVAIARWREMQKKHSHMLSFGAAHSDVHVSQQVSCWSAPHQTAKC